MVKTTTATTAVQRWTERVSEYGFICKWMGMPQVRRGYVALHQRVCKLYWALRNNHHHKLAE
jgi:hypothetical protein